MSVESSRDPRNVLVRKKYFSLRPKPLERWLWAQRVTPAAERVFWLHWQEGMQRGDWCSEVPLRRVARECCVDVSTVTKAYQLLARLGCLRRSDPGRDPANPFHQAVAVTEVRIPRELLVELNRHPDRRAHSAPKPEKCVHEAPPAIVESSTTPVRKAQDPFVGLSGRARLGALAQLERTMSAAELTRYREAHRQRQAHVSFDADSRLSAEDRGRVLQLLSIIAEAPAQVTAQSSNAVPVARAEPRPLSVFEIARLRRDIQTTAGVGRAPELLRQVVWSIEAGPLKRFTAPHAAHIALKKIREGGWTRPNRMPPNWARPLSAPSELETCRHA
jgi:hypothetical protein